MNWIKTLLLSGILVFLASCGNDQGPAEQAGEAVDQAMENVEDAVDEVDGEGPVEEAGEAVDEALEDAGAAASEAMDSAKASGSQMLSDAKSAADSYGDKMSKEAEETKKKAKEALQGN